MVAPSFQSMTIVGDIFTTKGKTYVNVRNEKTGSLRTVRWYTPEEYAKAYGKPLKKDDGFPMLKHARGFDYGPILVIRNNRPEDYAWLHAKIEVREMLGVGYFIASEDKLPEDAPPHFKYLLLSWNEYRDGDDFHAKDPAIIAKLLKEKEKKKEWFNIGSKE